MIDYDTSVREHQESEIARCRAKCRTPMRMREVARVLLAIGPSSPLRLTPSEIDGCKAKGAELEAEARAWDLELAGRALALG